MWFDHQELARILAWIRDGGFERSRQRDAEEERERQRQQRMTRTLDAELGGTWLARREEAREIDFLAELGGLLGRLFLR